MEKNHQIAKRPKSFDSVAEISFACESSKIPIVALQGFLSSQHGVSLMGRVGNFFVISILCLIVQVGHGADKVCSRENLEKLLGLTAKEIGESGHLMIMTSKMFLSPEYKNMTHDEIRLKFRQLKDEYYQKANPINDEIKAIITKHPECDKQTQFLMKGE